MLSHKTVSCNSSINTIDDVAKSFEKAINVGEKYLRKNTKRIAFYRQKYNIQDVVAFFSDFKFE